MKAKLVDTTKQDYFFFKEDLTNQSEPALKSKSQANGYQEYVKTIDFIENAMQYIGPDKSVENVFSTSGISWNMFGVANGLLGNKFGTSNARLSMKGLAEEDGLRTSGDGAYFLKDMSLLSVMETKFAPIINKVVKNAQVKKIDYSGEKITVTDQANKSYQADRLILTVPVTVLKDGDISFVPALPTTKVDAYSNIGMGGGIKAVLKFSQAFWETNTDVNLGSVIGYNEVPELWATSVGRGSTPLLTTLIMGEKGEMFSSMAINDAKGFILGHLDNIFGSNTASQSLLQDGFHLMDWGKEPFIKGTYSYPIVGGGLIFRKELAESIDGKLFFAGEATHYEGHSGTVHGAIETAIRAKDELEATIS
ncbi:MAG: FAD-dependent oxidoreductase [Saprospiraceae bacterium]|nr:FAD-dependent oxidoreductase [Saprospiraceae bacterium]